MVGASASLAISRHAFARDGGAVAEDPTAYVKPMIGTGGDGHCYPGATVPFGMVQLSPDTGLTGWDHCSGYKFDDAAIISFSHTHISGSGLADMLDFGLMPSVQKPGDDMADRDTRYRVGFSHSDETARPGYYSVALANGVFVELTATERTGLHRYTFPATPHAHVLLDLTEQEHPEKKVVPNILASELHLIGADTIAGFRQTNDWAKGRLQFFVMKFSLPISKLDIFDHNSLIPGSDAAGTALRMRIFFDLTNAGPLLVKTGISGVDIDGAAKNLAVESPGWDFDGTRQRALKEWRRTLSRIAVTGGTQKQKEIFYTGMYHLLIAPTLFDDVDGRYRGMDSEIHTLAAQQHNYSTFSLWDTYRAVHPLYTLFAYDRVPQMVNCLIRMSNQSALGPPVWPLQAKETSCMTGYHSAVVIAEAAVKNFPGIDLEAAWEPYRKRAMTDQYEGLAFYRTKGYIPCDLVAESCSKTTDYCYDDWAVAHLAKTLGHAGDCQLLIDRSGNYRNLYDPGTAFFRPKLNDGSWSTPFAPNEMGHWARWRDYTESNPWQTTFAVPHDPAGLAQLLGGRQALEAKLDDIFNANPEQPPDAPQDMAGFVGQYAQGNEPSHHIAYLYVYAGAPHKTQSRVQMLCETMYDNKPNGLIGNEDCGQMSAWYVISALGFYAVDPVSGNYVFGSPMFDRATVQVGEGKVLTIQANRNSPKDIYIQSITWNGKPYNKLWFRYFDIRNGGTFVLSMGPGPNLTFGVDETLAPPSRSNSYAAKSG